MKLSTFSCLAMIALTLSACENSQSHRQPIKSRKAGDVAALGGLEKLDAKCPVLSLSKAIGKLENSVIRYHTREIRVVTSMSDANNIDYSTDSKLVAQILNGSDDLRLQVKVELAKTALKKFDVLNVVSQDGCNKVKVSDSNGKIIEYSILSGEKGKTRLILKQTGNSEVIKVITIYQGSLAIRTYQTLSSSSICGKASRLLVEETTEISAISNTSGGVMIGHGLTEVLSNFTSVSDNLKAQFSQPKDSQKKSEENRARGSERSGGSRLLLPIEVVIEAYSRAQKSQFKNINCQ